MDVGWWLLILVLLLLLFFFFFNFFRFFGFSVDLHKWNRTKRVHCRTDAKPKVDKLALNEIRFTHDQSNCNNDRRGSRANGNIVMNFSFVTAAVCIVYCLYMCCLWHSHCFWLLGFCLWFYVRLFSSFFLFIFFFQINRIKWCIENPIEENATKIQAFNSNTCAKYALSFCLSYSLNACTKRRRQNIIEATVSSKRVATLYPLGITKSW